MKNDIERIRNVLKVDLDAAIMLYCYMTNNGIELTDENIKNTYENVKELDYKEIDEFIKNHVMNNLSSKEMNILLRFKKKGMSLENILEKTKYSVDEVMDLLNSMRNSCLIDFEQSLENPDVVRLTILGERVVKYLRDTYEL